MVSSGITLKRSLPRAQGRASLIEKKSSHVTLVLSEDKNIKNKFNIIIEKKNKDKQKTNKEEAKMKKIEATDKINKVSKEKPKDGLIKKMFRRKSI